MKLTFKTETHMKVIAESPDESMKRSFLQSIQDAYNQEAKDFFEEVRVAIRILKTGEKKTIQSRPIEVDIERTLEKEEVKS